MVERRNVYWESVMYRHIERYCPGTISGVTNFLQWSCKYHWFYRYSPRASKSLTYWLWLLLLYKNLPKFKSLKQLFSLSPDLLVKNLERNWLANSHLVSQVVAARRQWSFSPLASVLDFPGGSPVWLAEATGYQLRAQRGPLTRTPIYSLSKHGGLNITRLLPR